VESICHMTVGHHISWARNIKEEFCYYSKKKRQKKKEYILRVCVVFYFGSYVHKHLVSGVFTCSCTLKYILYELYLTWPHNLLYIWFSLFVPSLTINLIFRFLSEYLTIVPAVKLY
jgi:hypothetical protein